MIGLVALVSLAIAPPVHGVDDAKPRRSASFDMCMQGEDAKAGTTVAVHSCLAQETGVQEDRLNAVYKRVMARLSPERRIALRASERLWITKRDRACATHALEVEGGSLQPIFYDGCYVDWSIRRTNWLRRVS